MKERIVELESKVGQLTALVDASMELNSEIELKVVLQKVLNVMCEVIGAEAGTLWLLHQEDNVLCAEVANGPTADKILNIKLKYGEGIVGRVIATNRSELVEDVTKDSNWAKRVDRESGFITRSLMTVPLSVKTRVIGAMQLVNKRGVRLFNPEDLKAAEALANQAALAIHNSQLYDDIQKFSISVIRSLTLALDARDPYTAGHSERVGRYSVWIAGKLGLSEAECRELERAALMHDIGKIAVPDHILGKPGGLTDYEFGIMKMHPVNAAKILSKMEPRDQMIIAQEVSRYHHEKVNGMGYPDGLKAEEIPLYARIAAVADAFDAITTERPYKKARTFREGIEELIRCKGSHFDPAAVDAFAEVMAERNYLINNQERTMMNESPS
ncbi:MAG: HD domain-containing protein [Clostridia bacterium]|nr:HD domain-containing protein [Clostridia bacterium]